MKFWFTSTREKIKMDGVIRWFGLWLGAEPCWIFLLVNGSNHRILRQSLKILPNIFFYCGRQQVMDISWQFVAITLTLNKRLFSLLVQGRNCNSIQHLMSQNHQFFFFGNFFPSHELCCLSENLVLFFFRNKNFDSHFSSSSDIPQDIDFTEVFCSPLLKTYIL